jgi:hypothetical protein
LVHQGILGGVASGAEYKFRPVLALEFSRPVDEAAEFGLDAQIQGVAPAFVLL